jgi:hypothetical protein
VRGPRLPAASGLRGYREAVRRLLTRVNAVTLLLWLLAAGMAVLIVAEYVSRRV